MDRRPTRWERTDHRGYGAKFAQLHGSGQDIEGEARLADTMAPRGARILDAGCGMGRVGGTLRARGHDAYGVDLDAALLEQARQTYPQLPTMLSRIDDLTPETLSAQGFPTTYDLVVCVGNVMILGEPGSERLMLERMRDLLAPDGRILVGFHTDATPPHSRVYPVAEFDADVAAAGLRVDSRFGTYELRPYDPASNYAVSLLRRG
ncbi:class I SAM-dependent methyltransferase [Calidifontibacter indicus]|uniref:class I SAM-dependent methyltransferase n=1 Tax=Calidifontibacter indicus TaxID=419650 RepID=UPI003D71F0AD